MSWVPSCLKSMCTINSRFIITVNHSCVNCYAVKISNPKCDTLQYYPDFYRISYHVFHVMKLIKNCEMEGGGGILIVNK